LNGNTIIKSKFREILDTRAKKYVFLDYEVGTKGYVLFDAKARFLFPEI